MRKFDKTKDWVCPYCKAIAFEGENKLRHLAKHEPAVAKMRKKNFILNMTIMEMRMDRRQ